MIKINGTASSIAPLLPPLKPNQPNHKISVPKTAKGKLEPVNFPLLASEYLPILGDKDFLLELEDSIGKILAIKSIIGDKILSIKLFFRY